MPTELPSGEGFDRFRFLELSERGLFVDLGAEVRPERTRSFVAERLRLPRGTTDVFLWVHGWRNDRETARESAARLFTGIEHVRGKRPELYPQLRSFEPVYVAVHWPSQSSSRPGDYRMIRDRAHAMSENGTAEFVLAEVLGYLDEQQPRTGRSRPGTLRGRGGHGVHCVGHSFGGRFLCEAVAAAATPSLPTLAGEKRWEYTVDTLLVFQMAAPPKIFDEQLRPIFERAPLSGPVCLTRSKHDRAVCLWHAAMESSAGVGCLGARPAGVTTSDLSLLPPNEPYRREDLTAAVVNVDASEVYTRGALKAQGAHSDYWYEESIHLLLSLVSLSRPQ